MGDDERIADEPAPSTGGGVAARQHRPEGETRELLALAAHEISDGIQAVGLAADLIGRSPTVRLDPDASRAAETIVRIIKRLNLVSRDLTDLALLDRRRLALAPAPFELGEVLEAAAAELSPVASEKGVLVRVERSEQAVVGRGDRARILQVLAILGGNAVKFAPPRSTVTIGGRVDGETLRLDVSDEGQGIPRSHRELVLRGGVRAAPGAGGGAGLGLVIAKMIADLMEGSLRVDANEPSGTCFSFAFPRFPNDA